MDRYLSVGAAKIDVTPPFSIPYLGFDPRQDFFHGVHDPLFARAAVVGNGDQEIAIVSVDAIGYSDILLAGKSVAEELGKRVQTATGIPARNVLLSATHAHSTPETCCITPLEELPAARFWLETHLDLITSAVVSAHHNRRPCVLKTGKGDGRGIAWNRRILGKDGRLYAWHRRPSDDEIVDWGVNDHEVGVWLFEDVERETPVCVLTNFACHPTTVQVQPLVSADFPGLAMGVLEATLGCTALFLQGMCGNVRPVSTDHRFADVRRHGLALAGAVMKEVGTLMQKEMPASGTEIVVQNQKIPMPVREDGPDEDELLEKEAALLEEEETAGDEESRRRIRGRLRSVRESLRMNYLAREYPEMTAEVWAARIGAGAIVGLPGEPFVEFGVQLKEASPAADTLALGYIGNWVGYLPTQQAYERGGYEPSYGPWTRLRPGAGEHLAEVATSMLQGLW